MRIVLCPVLSENAFQNTGFKPLQELVRQELRMRWAHQPGQGTGRGNPQIEHLLFSLA